MVRMSQEVYGEIRAQAEAAYPEEACGVLLGTVNVTGTESWRVVRKVVSLRNVSSTPRRRYEVGLAELVAVEREARRAGLEIVGFCHSHPDHPARSSLTDVAEAHWIGSSYVITQVIEGEAGETRSYYLAGEREEDKSFEEEEIRATGPEFQDHS